MRPSATPHAERPATAPPPPLRWRILAPVAVLALLASACGGNADSGSGGSEPVTLSFLSYNYGSPDARGEGTQELIDAFEAEHPDIRIEPEGVPTAEVLTRLRTDTAAGDQPDVAQIGWSKMAEAYEVLPMVPVQDIPEPAEWEEHVAGITPAILEAVADEGKVRAMPYTMSIPILYYNADLFRAAGLDPATPPTTIAEVKEAALAITRTGAEGVYYGVVDPGKSDFLTQSLVASNGGRMVGEDGSVTFDQPEAVAALAAMQDLTLSGAQPAVNAEEAVAAFSGGNLGMLVTSTALLSSAQQAAEGKFELATAAFPSFGDRPAAPTYSGAGLAVLTDDEARQQAAWEFIRFLTSEKGFTIITEKIGYLPLRESITTDPAYLGDYFAENTLLLPSLEQLDSVTPYTFYPGRRANEAVVVLQDEAVEPIVLRGADPARTLAATAEKVRGLLQE